MQNNINAKTADSFFLNQSEEVYRALAKVNETVPYNPQWTTLAVARREQLDKLVLPVAEAGRENIKKWVSEKVMELYDTVFELAVKDIIRDYELVLKGKTCIRDIDPEKREKYEDQLQHYKKISDRFD